MSCANLSLRPRTHLFELSDVSAMRRFIYQSTPKCSDATRAVDSDVLSLEQIKLPFTYAGTETFSHLKRLYKSCYAIT